jgi:hypothetical protein
MFFQWLKRMEKETAVDFEDTIQAFAYKVGNVCRLDTCFNMI